MQSQWILLGGGCFWCVEAAFISSNGVISAESGYAGGHTPTPDYYSVCAGVTGHAEVVKIAWQPELLSLQAILNRFFLIHDPTSLNRQGNDVGTQYRSFIGCQNQSQLDSVSDFIRQQQAQYEAPIVTEISLAPKFYPADAAHQDYYRRNINKPYCQMIIKPKLDKLGNKD